jgi:hypothetical protein
MKPLATRKEEERKVNQGLSGQCPPFSTIIMFEGMARIGKKAKARGDDPGLHYI